MKKFLYFILLCLISCNGAFAQSLGRIALGCSRIDVVLNLPKRFNVCKNNTSELLTYTSNGGCEYLSIYFKDNLAHKIVMHKFIGLSSSSSSAKSKLEDVVMDLCQTWGQPSYTGEKIYWLFPSAKATFSHTTTSSQFHGPYGLETEYSCYVDIILEKRSSLFE